MFRISVGWVTLAGASFPDMAKAAGAAGFIGLSARVTGAKPDDADQVLLGKPDLIRQFKASLADAGIELSKVAAYKLQPDSRMSDYAPVLDLTAELNCKTISVGGSDPDDSRMVDRLSEYADMAQAIGARIALKFMPRNGVRMIDRAYRLVRATGKKNIGLTLDPQLMWRAGDDPATVATFDPALIYLMQLSDGPKAPPPDVNIETEARTARFYPGDGQLPLYDFLDLLPSHADEIECEVSYPAHRELSVMDRAKAAHDATKKFLDAYEKKRKPRAGYTEARSAAG